MCIQIKKDFPILTNRNNEYVGWKLFKLSSNGVLYSPYHKNYSWNINDWNEVDCAYGHGFYVFPTKAEAMKALAVVDYFDAYVIGKVVCQTITRKGLDDCSCRAFRVRRLKIVEVEFIDSYRRVKVTNYGFSNLATKLSYSSAKEIIVDGILYARRHKDGHWVLNPKQIKIKHNVRPCPLPSYFKS